MRSRYAILLGGGLALLAAILFSLIAGWSAVEPAGYDPHVRFLLRSDPIVAKLPPTPPTDLHPSGKLDEWIAGLPAKGGKLFEPAKLPKADRDKLATVLDDLFGTPAAPHLPNDTLGLTPDMLAAGSRVYKEKCAHCHGSSGDGRGPTGLYVYPPPRDFRLAKFKYLSTTVGLPTRADLRATVTVGIGGNSMPGFALLPPDQLNAVVGYVLFLAVRGRVETDLLSAVLSEDGLTGPPELFAEVAAARGAKRFAEAETKAAAVALSDVGSVDTEYALRRGFALFQTAGCASCHRDYGRQTHYLYDDWGVAVRPPNLTVGAYRGGGEFKDLFRRARCGIPPSGMPAVGKETLKDSDVEQLTGFVINLPFPQSLPGDVRGKVYP